MLCLINRVVFCWNNFGDGSSNDKLLLGRFYLNKGLMLVLFLSTSTVLFGQNSLNSGDFSSGLWGSGQTMGASVGGSLILTKTVSSSGNKYFRFYGDGTPCGEYQPISNGDPFISGTTKSIGNNCSNSNAWLINVPNPTDNVVFKTDGGNAGGNGVIFVLNAAPINVSLVSKDIMSPTSAQSVIITATLTATLPVGQMVYLRYQTGAGFGSATFVTMVGSSTTYTTTIPAQIAGTIVTYYVLTSGNSTPSNAESDLRTISWNAGSQNGGSNYSYTVTAAPTVAATTAATSIAATTATSGGNVTSDGGATITARGIVYDILTNPTLSNSVVTVTGTTGTFAANMTSLSSGTKYFVRAYATNSVGTTYGTETTFTALSPPTSQTAVTLSATSINLNWTKWTGDRAGTATDYNVMIVRSADNVFTSPTNGTSYSVGNTSLGGDTVIYNNNGISVTDTGLTAGTIYYYAFYSEGFSYYSTAVTASATTTAPAITAAKIGVNFNGGGTLFKYTVEPSCDAGPSAWTGVNLGTLFVGDPIVVTGGNLFSNSALTTTQFFSRVWLQSGFAGTYSSFNVTTATAPTCGTKYETTGGTATVAIANYATPGVYNFDVYHQGLSGVTTVNLGTASTPYTATFTVTALNTPTSQAATAASTSSINLSWVKSEQNNNVMIVRSLDNIFTTPTNGTGYSVGNTSLGGDTVIYNSNGTSYADTSLTTGTTYYYAFYSENYTYYSAGVTTTAKTNEPIVSAKVYLNTGGMTQFYGANLNYSCDVGQISDLKDGIPTVSTIYPGQTLKIGGNMIATGTITSPKMNYRMYLEGSIPGSFSQINLSDSSSTGCGTKQELSSASTFINTASLVEGSYIIEIYYEVSGFYWNNSGTNYKARFRVINESGIGESYAFIDLDNTGNKFFNLDGANGSVNPNLPTDLGTYEPGLDFNLGAEIKTYKLAGSTHKVCDCSNWYYIYDDTNSLDPTETNFPLPAAGTDFKSTGNGLFRRASTLTNILDSPNFTVSTATTEYNSLINVNVERYQNTGTGVDSQITFPTCKGTFRIASALLVKVSKTGTCSDASSLIYYRDINQDLKYKWDTGTDVILNPKRASLGGAMYTGFQYSSNINNGTVKNTISGNGLYFTTKITIGAPQGDTTWNGTSWTTSLGSSSTSNRGKDLIFAADYTVSSALLSVNSITVNDGITVTIPDGKYIEVYNDTKTNGTGKIVVANQGNLVQKCDNTSIIKPNIQLTKTTRNMKTLDYVYWGAPVSNNIIDQFSSAFGRKYYWDNSSNSGWQTITTSTPGVGFISRIETAGINSVTFTGTANNGIITSPVTNFAAVGDGTHYADYGDFALLSNPYPCAIDAYTFLTNPNNSNILSTLYFWTSITPIALTLNANGVVDNPYVYNYNTDDYASWNKTGGVATASKAFTDASNSFIPSGKIASGQGFFAEVSSSGNVVFDNSMRLTDNVNTQFFKLAPKKDKKITDNLPNTEKNPSPEEGRIWLNISNKGNFRQMLIGYMKGATNEYDRQYDGEVYSDSPILIYSMVGDKNLVIQGKKLPFDENETIPIGIDTAEAGEFYINIDQVDGFFKNKDVYLKDNLLETEIDLKQNAYKFTTEKGIFKDRFELKYLKKENTNKVLGNQEYPKNPNLILVSTGNNQIKVNSNKEEIAAISIYDMSGKLLLSTKNINKYETVLDKFSKQNSLLLVKVTLVSKTEVTKKILF